MLNLCFGHGPLPRTLDQCCQFVASWLHDQVPVTRGLTTAASNCVHSYNIWVTQGGQ